MESNMTLTVDFKGAVNKSGIPVFNHDGAPNSIGGIMCPTDTAVAYFGRVVSEDPAALHNFSMGIPSGMSYAGILQNDNAISENDPAKSTYLLGGMPATAIFFGLMWLGEWTHAAAAALTIPVRGCICIFKNTTGQIEFMASGTSVIPTGYTQLNASVKDYSPETNKVLLMVGVTDTLITPAPSSSCAMKSFKIIKTGAAGFSAVGNIVESTGAISVTVPAEAAVTALLGNFILSDGASAKIATNAQVSGVTANNFTSPVVYVVTAADGAATTSYTVTVTVATASTACALKSFAIVGTGATGFSAIANIIESTGVVAVTVPAGTTVTALIANFVLSDGAIMKISSTTQVSGVTANNFTSAVTFVVTAADVSTTKSYTVTVTVHS